MLTQITVLLALMSVPSAADCGDQRYFGDPRAISSKQLRRAVGTLTFTGEPVSSTETLHVFLDRGGLRPVLIEPGDATPIASMPTCRSRESFDGMMFPATAISSGAVRIVVDWKSGREVWVVGPAGKFTAYFRDFRTAFDPRLGHSAVDIFFRRDVVKVYASPRLGARFTELKAPPFGEQPAQRSAYKVLGRRGKFLHIGEGAGRVRRWLRLVGFGGGTTMGRWRSGPLTTTIAEGTFSLIKTWNCPSGNAKIPTE
ncbi:MAG: hypothetical protein M0D55_14420 [Elusimicrobiota bacterium]|nr:MAG: hypothetical protein M0D55_14420 [Elusimicrobiota bacterium]